MFMRKKAADGETGGQNGGHPLVALADQTLNPLKSVIRFEVLSEIDPKLQNRDWSLRVSVSSYALFPPLCLRIFLQ